jgi:hypothetical protein
MHAYIDSICSRTSPPTAAAVRPTKSALLLQSHQLERMRQLDEKAAQELALQTGKGRPVWGWTAATHRGNSTKPVQRQAAWLRQRDPSPSSFSSSAVPPRTSHTLSPRKPPAACRTTAWPKRSPHPLGLPPTSPTLRHRDTSANGARAWTPFAAAHHTPHRRQPPMAAAPSPHPHGSPPASPWHPLFSASPSPETSPMVGSRLVSAVTRDDVTGDSGAGWSSPADYAAVAGRPPPPFYTRSRRRGIEGKEGADDGLGWLTNGPDSMAAASAARSGAGTPTALLSSPSPLLRSSSPPPAVWAAWHPLREHQPTVTARTDTASTTSWMHQTVVSPVSAVAATAAASTVLDRSHCMGMSPSRRSSTPARRQHKATDAASKEETTPAIASTSSRVVPSSSFRHAPRGEAVNRTSTLSSAEVETINRSRTTPPRQQQQYLPKPATPLQDYPAPSQSMRKSSVHRRRHGGAKSLRDLHDELFEHIQSRSCAPSAKNGHASTSTTGAVLNDAAATAELWRATRALHRSLAEERASLLSNVSNARRSHEGCDDDDAARGGRGSVGDRTTSFTRAYLYAQDTKEVKTYA